MIWLKRLLHRDQLTAIVTEHAPELLALTGMGAVTGAVVLCVWSTRVGCAARPR
jgi:hypothetical protein